MEWWEGEKKPPEPNGNDSSDVPAFNSETVYAPRKKWDDAFIGS